MKRLFRKLLVTVAGVMCLSACASLLPSMPNFNPGDSSYNGGASKSTQSSGSTNDYDGPYTLSFFGTDFKAEVGKRFKVNLLAYNKDRQNVGISRIEVNFNGLNVDDVSIPTANSYISFIINEPCSEAKIDVTAYVRSSKYEVTDFFNVTAYSPLKLVVSDSGTVEVKRHKWHRTVVELLDTNNNRADVRNFECYVDTREGNVSYGVNIIRNLNDNTFEAYTMFHEFGSGRLRFGVYDYASKSNYDSEVTFSCSQETDVYAGVGWGSDFIIGREMRFDVSLRTDNWGETIKIQDVYLISSDPSIIPNVSKEGVNTTDPVSLSLTPIKEGDVSIVFKIVAANLEIYYEIIWANVFPQDAFYFNSEMSEPYQQNDWKVKRGVEHTLTISAYSRFNSEPVELRLIDLTETRNRYLSKSMLDITSATCSGNQATIVFTVGNGFVDTFIEFYGYLVSTSGRKEEFGFGYEIWR